jgi:NTE family protein
MGYSPAQIETLVNTASFKDMSEGIIDNKYAYYFKRTDNNASWVTFKLSLDSVITARLPTNVMSPIAMDFGLMELLGAPAASKNNFDSLFIPFRCVASDIEKKESVVFRKGDLAEAVRASVAYPFYIPPIMVDGKLLFDGGLYNNFPSNIMYNDFFPDFIIGSNVSSNSSPDEDNLFSQIKCMLQSKSNYNTLCEGGVIIEPNTEVGLFNFSNPQPIIDSGYAATMRKIDFIKQYVERRTDPVELESKRKAYKAEEPKIMFDNIYIEGLNKNQSEYARRVLRQKQKQVSMEVIKQGYFRLASDNKIKSINPKVKFNPQTGFYDLYLKIKKERDIITYFGGNFSNRPISEGFVGVQYNYLGRFATTVMANAYFGKLYNSAQLKTRFDFPFKIPIYIEPNITYNNWDYYTSSNNFLQDVKPAYLKQSEEYGDLNIGFPTGKKGRIVGGVGLMSTTNKYYQTSNFTVRDTADRTDFNGYTAQAYFESNTLNRKLYANQGEYVNFRVRFVNGEEINTPGSTSKDTSKLFKKNHQWVTFKAKAERYFNRRGTFKIGLFGEGVYSTQTLFHNYTSSVLSAPAFQPTPDSKTIFLQNYRAYQYLAGGLRFIVNIRKNIEFRTEVYVFQPIQALEKTNDLKTTYGKALALQHYIGTSGVVWHTPIGPMSLSVNYYDQEQNPFSILFHFGYIIFNRRALE